LEAKEALYLIAQEALHNTVKHARAKGVDLKMERGFEDITLEISDDGAGFDPEGDFPGTSACDRCESGRCVWAGRWR